MLVMASEFRKFIKIVKKSGPGNLVKLDQFFKSLRNNLEKSSQTVSQIKIDLPNDSKLSLFLKFESAQNQNNLKFNYKNLVPEKMIDSQSSCVLSGNFSIPEINHFQTDQYSQLIKNNKNYIKKWFGIDSLCFSKISYETFTKIIRYSITGYPILFYGEKGTGRTELAKGMHFFREGGELTEINCSTETNLSLATELEIFLQKDNRSKPGLLLQNIDQLEDLSILESLITMDLKERYVYLTSSISFFDREEKIPDVIYHGLSNLSIRSIPFRERPEDLFFIIFDKVDSLNHIYDQKIKKISSQYIQNAMNAWLPENSIELENIIAKGIEKETSSILSKFSAHEETKTMPSVSLTPLEEGEKNVILEYLQKNNFNKNKTRKDLGISINTLNTKIEKYGIVTK